MPDPPKAFYIPDYPAVEPRFEYQEVASALIPLLVRKDDKGATVVGIHGPWGAGKTTLMDAIRAKLPTASPNGIPIVFNAWKFQDREALWRALILHVLGQLRAVRLADWKEKNKGKDEAEFEDAEITQVEDKLYRAFTVDVKGPWKIEWRSLIVELLTIGLSLFQLGFVGKAIKSSTSWLGKLFTGGEDKDGKKKEEGVLNHDRIKELSGVLTREVLHRQVNQVQSIEQFLDEFQKLVKKFENRRIFVFIDDLDRCLPESALEIFEAIKLFLDSPGISYVVALDRDTIRKALAVRYSRRGAAAADQSFLDPDEYIEKTISLSFDLPKLSREDALSLVADFELPVTMTDQQKIDIPKQIVRALGRNPRRLRRFMNTLVVNLTLVKSLKENGAYIGQNLDLFVKLMLIAYRHSAVFGAAREDAGLLIRLQEYYNQSAGNDQNARDARLAAVRKESPLVAAQCGKDEFWRVIRIQPQLNNQPDTVKNMMNWFRYRTAAPDKQKGNKDPDAWMDEE
jgi:hypothetical protein